MITVYLAAITSQYEGEDIEVRYCIFDEQELKSKKSILLPYQKPAVAGQAALIAALTELMEYQDREMTIIVNDGALNELVRGTSTTKNKDVLKKFIETREALGKFDKLTIKDVSGNRAGLLKWNEAVQF